MTETNGMGAATPLLPSVTELVMSNGVVIWVRPASMFDQRLILEELDKRHPLPKEKEFQIPVPEDQATIPGQTMTDIAAYKETLGKINIERMAYFIRAHILACVDFPEGVDTVVARYLPEIERKRRSLSLPNNDLEAVLMHAVVTTPEDIGLVRSVIEKTAPLTAPEVTDQLRIFRLATGNHAVSNGRKAASRAVVGEKGTQ